MIIKCTICARPYKIKPSHISRRKTCSRSCRKVLGWHSESTKKSISISVKANPTRYWTGKGELSRVIGTGLWMSGKKASPQTKEKHRQNWLGEKNPNWRGGLTKENQRFRNTAAYREWRNSVFSRDNWTCQECGNHGVKLHADHIKPFATHYSLRLEISNGRTLCVDCHKKTDTYLNKRHLKTAA